MSADDELELLEVRRLNLFLRYSEWVLTPDLYCFSSSRRAFKKVSLAALRCCSFSSLSDLVQVQVLYRAKKLKRERETEKNNEKEHF